MLGLPVTEIKHIRNGVQVLWCLAPASVASKTAPVITGLAEAARFTDSDFRGIRQTNESSISAHGRGPCAWRIGCEHGIIGRASSSGGPSDSSEVNELNEVRRDHKVQITMPTAIATPGHDHKEQGIG